jgi:hypothetical protein
MPDAPAQLPRSEIIPDHQRRAHRPSPSQAIDRGREAREGAAGKSVHLFGGIIQKAGLALD